jgi:hypothetical protein
VLLLRYLPQNHVISRNGSFSRENVIRILFNESAMCSMRKLFPRQEIIIIPMTLQNKQPPRVPAQAYE